MPVLPQKPLQPYWQTTDKQTIRLYQGDIFDVAPRLPAKSVHMVVTSPPYWALRSYATEENNKHKEIGSEATPEEFVETMVKVFREVRRVLRDDGTCWINLGDNYCKGQLMGMPWRVALALQADGWILRQDIIWAKPSPMPESCRNRCTKSHEYIFLLAKKYNYFYDMEAVREKTGNESSPEEYAAADGRRHFHEDDSGKGMMQYNSEFKPLTHPDGRNKRSVWTIASQGYEGAHFATFPEALIEPCILAGTSEYGCCAKCGAPYVRVTEVIEDRVKVQKEKTNRDRSFEWSRNGIDGGLDGTPKKSKTIGWNPSCNCGAAVVPCTVLEPFVGSGTTCCVSLKHGRRSIGIDLSKTYLDENCIPRIEGELWTRGMQHLFGRPIQSVNIGKPL